MSVYKKVQLPSKVICSAAAMACSEEDIAVATDDGIYILVSNTRHILYYRSVMALIPDVMMLSINPRCVMCLCLTLR